MKNVSVQGLGFVGAAMAVAIADTVSEDNKPLFNVIGIELDNEQGRKKVQLINEGIFPVECEDVSLLSAFKNSIDRGNLYASTDESHYADADIVIVDINLDLIDKDESITVSWEPFKNAIKTLGNNIKRDTLVIIETTVPPGTCEFVVLPILQECFARRGFSKNDVLLCHSYERVMPGQNYLDSIRNFWRVYSGHNEKAAKKCEDFLETIINTEQYPLTRLSSLRASETAKVMENSYRAANIAFIEEWSAFAQKIQIDLFEVIESIKMRPTHSNVMNPGFGVGGYCLTKDPLFASIAGNELFEINAEFPFCKMAVQINNEMPYSAVRLLKQLLGDVREKRILLMGISYRPDIGDSRYSPSETFAKKLLGEGAKLTYHDPYIRYWSEMNEQLETDLPKPKDFDAVVFAVAHKEYATIIFEEWLTDSNVCIIDANNVLTKGQRELLKNLSNPFASIGRGDI